MFACAVIAVVVSDGGVTVMFSCTNPRTMPSHGVVRQLVLDNIAPPFLKRSCRYCSASRAVSQHSFDCISKSTTTFTSCGSGTFQLDRGVHTPGSRHLAPAARCCWSSKLVDTALDLFHERPSEDLMEIPSETRQLY